jgi:hypothetical protein
VSPWITRVAGSADRKPRALARRTSGSSRLRQLRGKGQSPEYRRWKDLCRHYEQRIGVKRLADEATRALLLHLIDLTLRVERDRDLPREQQMQIETLLHTQQEIRALLTELNLTTRSVAQNGTSDAQSGLHDYINGESAA